MREQRHSKEAMLNHVKEEAPIHPRTQSQQTPKIDAELAKFLDEADEITKPDCGSDLPRPVSQDPSTTAASLNLPSPPTTPDTSNVDAKPHLTTTSVPKDLESSSPSETLGKEVKKDSTAPWRKVTKSIDDNASPQ